MIDGKVIQAQVCLAKPSEMKNLTRVSEKPEREETFRFGLSTLHVWIHFKKLVLHISYNLAFQKWSVSTDENKNL